MGKSSPPSRAPETFLKALKHVTFLNKSSCAGTWTVKGTRHLKGQMASVAKQIQKPQSV